MGRHYFNLNYDVDMPCTPELLTPVQLVYTGGQLNAFVWQHVAAATGSQWEILTDQAVTGIVVDSPSCIYDLVANPGIRTMHTYVRDYVSLCINDRAE